MRISMEFWTWFSLASDAAELAVIGAGFIVLAALAMFMEWRRNKYRSLERLEKVGWVPWTPLFVACTIVGGGCLAMSLPVVIGGLL